MDDVTQLLDGIRQEMLAALREFRDQPCGPHHSETFAAARAELLERLELRILGTSPQREPEAPVHESTSSKTAVEASDKLVAHHPEQEIP